MKWTHVIIGGLPHLKSYYLSIITRLHNYSKGETYMKQLFKKLAAVVVLFSAAAVGHAADEVTFHNHGKWVSHGDGFYQHWDEAMIWVDVSVANLGYQKTVGIRWTVSDKGGAWNDAYASYKYTQGDGRELWGLEMSAAGVLHHHNGLSWLNENNHWGYGSKTVEYAIYYIDQTGNWYWDNNGGQNYKIDFYPADFQY